MKIVAGLAFPDADTFMCRELRADGTYQAAHLTAAMRFVTDRRCAIDGGAHVGQFSLGMSALFARVIAVEPAPDTFECLQFNLAGRSNVETKQIALGAAPGAVALELDAKQTKRGNTGGRYVVSDPAGAIARVAIDEWRLPALGFLKLDVEGSEPLALAGAAWTIRECRPIVLFEDKGFCSRYGYAKDASQALLAGLGYEHLARVGHDEIWGPRA